MRSATVAAFVLAGVACREKATPPAAPAPVAAASRPLSPPGRSDAACAAPFDGAAAREKLRSASGEVKIGALAGLKDADDENVAFIRLLVAELQRRGADVLVADGDLGDNADEQETLLGTLTETGLPVLAVAGNREVRSELDAAEAELRKKGGRIVDLSHTRVVDLGDASVVGLPGTFDRRQLHSEGACVYVQKDIDAVSAALDRIPPPIVLVAAVPPRGNGRASLDLSEGQNVGDPRLSPLLAKAQFGIFGQVWESGGRAVDGAGALVAPRTNSPRLYVNPGAADHTPWPLVDGSIVAGQAALLTVHGRTASWEPIRLPEEKR
jgi:Icc-related predicted phosphoesterase